MKVKQFVQANLWSFPFWIVFNEWQFKYFSPLIRPLVFNNPVYKETRYVKRKMMQHG